MNVKKLMILSDLSRFAVVLCFVFVQSLWQVYVLLIIKSCFSALFVPAKNGKLKEIIDDQQMQKAMGISGMIDNSSKIIGPMLSGVLVSFIGVTIAFYIDAFTFLLSALLLLGVSRSNYVKKENREEKSTIKQSITNQMMVGLIHIKTVPVFVFGLFGISFALLILQIADSQMMILLRGIQGDPVEIAGYSLAASGAGMFTASAILTKKEWKVSLPTLLTIGITTLGLGICASSLVVAFPYVVVSLGMPIIFFLVGFSFTSIILPFNIAVQKGTPVQLSGRVFGTINSFTMLATIIGMVCGGLFYELLGVRVTFFVSGSLLIVIGLGALMIKKELERRDPYAESDEGIQGKSPA